MARIIPDRRNRYEETAAVGMPRRVAALWMFKRNPRRHLKNPQPVHPVLIRNEHNVLLQLTIDSMRQSTARLQSFEFSLAGTDSLDDVELLEVLPTGPKAEFVPEARFGEAVKPAEKIKVQGDYTLHPGANVFWLSCRLRPTADLLHKVAASAASITVDGGNLVIAGQPAAVRHRIGIALRKHNDDGVHTYRIPALATGPKGTLCASTTCGGASRATCRRTSTSGSAAAPTAAGPGSRRESSWTWASMAACRRNRTASAIRASSSIRRRARSFFFAVWM